MVMVRMKASTWYIGGRLLQAIPLVFWVIVFKLLIINENGLWLVTKVKQEMFSQDDYLSVPK